MCAAPIWSKWPPDCRVGPIAGIWDINGFRGSVALSGAVCPGRNGAPASIPPRVLFMTDAARAFRGFRFPAEVILWAVRWYLQFPISYRDLERMLADRGVT